MCSDDEGMYDDTAKEKTSGRYKHKGVEDEDDLRKMISSDEDSDEDEEKKKEEEEREEDKEKKGNIPGICYDSGGIGEREGGD